MFTSSLTLSSLLGVIVVFYLCSFLCFAVLRIITGVSIQRFGYLSIRGIRFSRGGVDFSIVRAGIILHRPTFSQPTWISFVIRDSKISFNPKVIPDEPHKPEFKSNGNIHPEEDNEDEEQEDESVDPKAKPVRSTEDLLEFLKDGGDDIFKRRTRRQVEETKKLVQRCRKLLILLRKYVGWIRMVDVGFQNTTFEVRDAGKIQIGAVSASIITRKDTSSHSGFSTSNEVSEEEGKERNPFECVIACRSVLLTPEGSGPVLLTDTVNLNIGGVLEEHENDQVLKDVSVDMKVGKLRIPLDEILAFKMNMSKQLTPERPLRHKRNFSLGSIMGEMSMPGSRTERLVEIVTESKDIFSSIINGLQEVQVTVAILEVSKIANDIRPSGKPLIATMSLKELGLDLHRLEQDSPAHRMDFGPDDIAHQALLAAISMAFKIDDQRGSVDQLLYVPMITVTSKMTLPSKIIELAECPEADRNSNIVNANIVVTSPSVDLEPKHLPIVVNLFKPKNDRVRNSGISGPQQLVSRLLPKTNIKFSVHEPVVRVLLPAFDKANPRNPPLTDMLIYSVSSASTEVESSHAPTGQNHYVVTASLRVASQRLFYRASAGERHDLFQLETIEVKCQLDASPEVRLAGTCLIESCTTRMVRMEIVQGIKQMVRQFQRDIVPDAVLASRNEDKPSFLRSIPEWLVQFKIDAKDFSFEVAGKDEEISDDVRGAAVQIDSWSLEYKSQVISKSREKSHPKRRTSRAIGMDEKIPLQGPRPLKNPTDGRRLSFHIHGLEGFAVDSAETWDADPMCALPHFELALSSVTDQDGPTLLLTSHTKTLFLHYSLLRHYSVLIAALVLKDAFGEFNSVDPTKKASEPYLASPTIAGVDFVESPAKQEEFVSVDIRIRHVKIKGDFPKNPKAMLDIYHLDAGRQRWGFPFLKARNIRLYVTSPKLNDCWARVISAKHFRGDMREGRYETQKVFSKRKSLDLTMEAIRIAIPHQLVLYKLTDNLVNTAKASKQLFHRFKSGTNEYILEKKAEEAKILPRISIKAKALQFELEDDLFESKLAMIYRIGLSEQQNRIAREEAFDAKVAKVIESKNRRQSSKAFPHSPTGLHTSESNGSRKNDDGDQDSPTHDNRGRRKMRYNLDHAQAPSHEAKISIDAAWRKLQEHNSQVWIRKMRSAVPKTRARIQAMRRKFIGEDDLPPDVEETERILEIPARPALAIASIVDFDLTLDKPSFPLDQLPKFLCRVGKGLPENTQFSLLVPIHLKLNMGEARINLRDYPLPLIHIPQMKSGISPRIPAWSLETDFVIAEELRDKGSLLHVRVDIVPPEDKEGKKQKGFAVDVHRTVSPVKTYSDIDVSINTPYTTRVTWGTSYQPAIQDMMMVFETFTKPHVDPSEKIGFWDKLRLSVHSRIRWAWKGDGDVQVTLKGSRDPYVITGHGAGFVKCWRGDVRCFIANDDRPQNFLIVESKEYFLAIPDFSQQALQIFEESSATAEDDQSFMTNDSYNKSIAIFKKVILKATGGVKWQLGLMFEQETTQETDWTERQRSFKFLPHYKITLRTPEAVKALRRNSNEEYDAFKGFRSHHIHLSISMIAPMSHDWSSNKMASAYNTIHLTPRVFTHFYDWWGLFSGVMSLPIRQGALFPGVEKSTKKFGRHLATIKYKLLLSPLYLSHIYKHKDAEEYKAEAGGGNSPSDMITATGLKVKLHRFSLDAHQRKEESVMKLKGLNVDRRSTNMSIHQAELDFNTADIRAVSATIASSTSDDVKDWAGFDMPINDNATPLGDSSNFSISDGDTDWIDVDDFVELDWILPTRFSPSTKIMPLASTPRFTYIRQTDHTYDSISGRKGKSPFGHEASHDCMMNRNNDPREIQCGLIESRMEKVYSQLSKNQELLDTLAESIKQDRDNPKLPKESERLSQQSSVLTDKLKFLQNMLRHMSKYLDESAIDDEASSVDSKSYLEEPEMLDAEPFNRWDDDFNNRFIVHNMQAKWSNDLRNVILRYIHQVNQRRGFVYYMSRRAVKFILDLVEEQQMDKEKKKSQELDADRASLRGVWENGGVPGLGENEENVAIQSRIEALLNDKAKVVAADDDTRPRSRRMSMGGAPADPTDLKKGISEEYIPLNSYHVRLIAPQIQMQSEKNKSSALLVTSQSMQLTVISIMDKERMGDPVSGLVQRRFALELENAQAFVARHKDFTSPLHNLHSNNQYGCVKNTSWPPWVPLENMLLFDINPHGFSRVVKKTSTTLRADKHNSLRLKLIDEGLDSGTSEHNANLVENEPRVDHVWATFDRMEVSTNSAEYYTLYIIVLDLLLYSEPLEKSRNERLEKIILASDFSDLKGAPDIITALQSRIQQLEEIKTHFQINARNLDKQGWLDRLCLEKDLATCEDELFFTMKSIMSVQRKYDERQQTTGLIRWYLSAGEIIANLLLNKDQPFLDLKLTNACYERTDNSDGSNFNTVEVEMLQGVNRLSDATYPNMISPYLEGTLEANKAHQNKILRVYWYMLEAIAGIPVMDHFEVNLFPLLVQLDYEAGQKLFEFIFPGVNQNSSEGFSPFMMKPSLGELPDDSGTDSDSDNAIRAQLERKISTESGSANKPDTSMLEDRLMPTMTSEKRPQSSGGKQQQRPLTSGTDSEKRTLKPRFSMKRQRSFESIPPLPPLPKKIADEMGPPPRISSESNIHNARPTSPVFIRVNSVGGSSTDQAAAAAAKKVVWGRSNSMSTHSDGKASQKEKTDEISQMISRASNYMTLAYIKIPSVVLCLSYKGKGDRNIEDIHQFVFRMPTLEYRNKTWSNLDLLVRLKKDVIRALISHTGAIIEHKMFHRRPHLNKGSNIRNLVAASASMATTPLGSETDVSSYLNSPYEESVRSQQRPRTAGGSTRRDRSTSSAGSPLTQNASLSGSESRALSVRSSRSYSSSNAARSSNERITAEDRRNSRPTTSRDGDERVRSFLPQSSFWGE
ncbi:hypothetical protein AA313_de0203483 [Arthrobotrys entomopaga]|nr:hypothetical protein AA313_de0203483 [Arthrobotrys entomopaga]